MKRKQSLQFGAISTTNACVHTSTVKPCGQSYVLLSMLLSLFSLKVGIFEVTVFNSQRNLLSELHLIHVFKEKD